MSEHAKTIEAILFAEARPFTFLELTKLLGITKEAVEEAISELKNSLKEHGLVVVESEDQVSLGTHPHVSVVIEKIRKEMLQKELTKAAAETLAVILYHPGTSRAEIEFIRGVNASYSLRLLQIRGLIEQKQKEGERGSIFYPTTELLMHFGVANAKALPEYSKIREQLTVLLVKQS